jgi:hypothetical protein
MLTCESVVDVKPHEDDAHLFPSSVNAKAWQENNKMRANLFRQRTKMFILTSLILLV